MLFTASYKKHAQRERDMYLKGYNDQIEAHNKELVAKDNEHKATIKALKEKQIAEMQEFQKRLEKEKETTIKALESAHSETVKTLERTIEKNEKDYRTSLSMISDQYALKEKKLNRHIERYEEKEQVLEHTDATLKAYTKEAQEVFAKKYADIEDMSKNLVTLLKGLEDFKHVQKKADKAVEEANGKVVKIQRSMTS